MARGEKALTLYSSTQIPHLMRTLVARMLGMPENRLRVITPEVGGGFGSKLNVYAEEALMGFIAMKIGKPVKWIESRRENFQCTIHGRGHVDYFELAAKRDGTILGHQAEADPGSRRVSSAADAGHSDALRADDAGPVQVRRTFARTSSASSPTACPPMRIAAPAVRKRRTASSAWWTSSRPN